MATRVWFFEEEFKGFLGDKKFSVDSPCFIPRIGEFVESDEVSGWVWHVQHSYSVGSAFDSVVHVYLGKEKPRD